MKKQNLINDIVYVIKTYGDFNTSVIMAESSPIIDTKGNLSYLVEEFYDNCVKVDVYSSNGNNPIDTYTLQYEELSLNLLKEIRELAIVWQEQQIDELDND